MDEEGKSSWVFESRSQKSLQRNPISTKESTIFWITLLVCPILWVMFFFSSFFRFGWKWIPLIMIAISLNGANLIGYLRCKFSGTQQLTKMANDYVTAGMFSRAFSMAKSFGSKAAPNAGAGGGDAFAT